jgi:hypothetical protein
MRALLIAALLVSIALSSVSPTFAHGGNGWPYKSPDHGPNYPWPPDPDYGNNN